VPTTNDWICALTLDAQRQTVAGSAQALAAAIGRGADLRIATEFRHNEHIDVTSQRDELVREVAEFAITYLLDGRWTAGIMSLRQPVELPTGFGPRSSMSYFLYNEDGGQAIARLHLDGGVATASPGPSPVDAPGDMPKYHALHGADTGTNAPSHNFVYDFDVFHYWVCDRWTEVLAHDERGRVSSGGIETLTDAFGRGCRVKVAVSGLCDDLGDGGPDQHKLDHELFVEIGSSYYYTSQGLFIGGSHPVVRVRPDIPMVYHSHGWDSGWLVVRTDGTVIYRRCDPYTLAFDERTYRCGLRWFVS
jgi:hypothetical protein